jgi:hypothetical protein
MNPFGGTRRVAEAIADGLASTTGCTVVEVNHAPTVISRDTDLLVIGAPTHAFGLSTRDTRREAQDETPRPVISAELGVREWLAALVVLSTQTRTAAFDTRVKQRWVAGSAAQKVPCDGTQGSEKRAAGLLQGRGEDRAALGGREACPGARVGRDARPSGQ